MAVRIVRARPEEAFVVAALSLQMAIALDGAREEGYLDRAAEHWLRHHEQLPTWYAEHERQHAGLLQATHPPESTWPGRSPGTGGSLWIHALYVSADHRRQGIALALTRACEAWARGAGVDVIRLPCADGGEDFAAAAGYAPVADLREKRLHPRRRP